MKTSHEPLASISFSGMRRLNPCRDPHDRPEGWRNGRTYALGNVNIFAGRNGSGKSTVLDMIDFLRDPGRICTLPRENRKINSHCFFEFRFDSQSFLLASVVSNALDQHEPTIPGEAQFKFQCISLLSMVAGGPVHEVVRNISKSSLDPESHRILTQAIAPLPCKVSHWDNSRSATVPMERLAFILNAMAPHLCGLASDPTAPLQPLPPGFSRHWEKTPIVLTNEDEVGVYHSDDLTQFNCVAADAFPSGWRSIVSLVHYLQTREPGEICLFEEPESNLHPALQRLMIREMSRAVLENKIQLFISTHSMTVQSPSLWHEAVTLKLFELNGHEMLEGIDERRMLENLGVQGSEYGACNGIVWVEGPSDRIYLKHWISLYCADHGLAVPVEHADYAFAFHGGSLLSHLAVQGVPTKTNISRIHRNFVVLMDRDDDFDAQRGEPVGGTSAKHTIVSGIAQIDSESCVGLLTPGYTVESSLPGEFRDLYFEDVDGRLRLVRGKKVGIASRYAALYFDWKTCFDQDVPMRAEVAIIVRAIQRWNRAYMEH